MSRNCNKAFPTEPFSPRELGKLTVTHSLCANPDPKKGLFPLHIQGREEPGNALPRRSHLAKRSELREPSLFHRTGTEIASRRWQHSRTASCLAVREPRGAEDRRGVTAPLPGRPAPAPVESRIGTAELRPPQLREPGRSRPARRGGRRGGGSGRGRGGAAAFPPAAGGEARAEAGGAAFPPAAPGSPLLASSGCGRQGRPAPRRRAGTCRRSSGSSFPLGEAQEMPLAEGLLSGFLQRRRAGGWTRCSDTAARGRSWAGKVVGLSYPSR